MPPEATPVPEAGDASRSPGPLAILLCGPSLAGKSTVAGRLRAALGATVISADEINAQRGLPFGGEGLPESVWAETLRIQIEQLHACGRQGHAVVVDDTLCYRWLRDRLRNEALRAGLGPRLLTVQADDALILQRREQLASSAARPVLGRQRLLQHLVSFEWPTEDEQPILLAPGADVLQLLGRLNSSTGEPLNEVCSNSR